MPASNFLLRSTPYGIIALTLLTAAMTLSVFSVPLPAPAAKAAVLVALTIGFWATGLLSEALTALLFFVSAIVFEIAPPEVVFSGLGSSAFWMVFAGLVIGLAIKSSGLSQRIGQALARRIGTRPSAALAGATVFGVLLAFAIPSAMGRIVLIIPVLDDLVQRLGYPAGGKTARGIMLGGILGTSLPSTAIFPANIPNNVQAGLSEHLFGHQTAYGDYLLLHFPVLGLLKTLLLIGLLVFFYRGDARPVRPAPEAIGIPYSPAERRLTWVLLLAVVFWATDGLHHIAPAWVGLAAAVLCLFPGIGVLPPKALQNVNAEPLLYISAVVGTGALISESGLGHKLAAHLQGAVSRFGDGSFGSFMALCGISTIVGLLTTLPAVPAVLTPLTPDLAAASGLPEPLVLATQVIGFSTLLFPYQAPPLAMALQLSGLPRWEMTRLCLIVAAVSVVVLWPLDHYWLALLRSRMDRPL